MKAIIINSKNIVDNVIVWDETCSLPETMKYVVVDDDFVVSIGWIYNGENFTDPNPKPPEPTFPEVDQERIASLKGGMKIVA